MRFSKLRKGLFVLCAAVLAVSCGMVAVLAAAADPPEAVAIEELVSQTERWEFRGVGETAGTVGATSAGGIAATGFIGNANSMAIYSPAPGSEPDAVKFRVKADSFGPGGWLLFGIRGDAADFAWNEGDKGYCFMTGGADIKLLRNSAQNVSQTLAHVGIADATDGAVRTLTDGAAHTVEVGAYNSGPDAVTVYAKVDGFPVVSCVNDAATVEQATGTSIPAKTTGGKFYVLGYGEADYELLPLRAAASVTDSTEMLAAGNRDKWQLNKAEISESGVLSLNEPYSQARYRAEAGGVRFLMAAVKNAEQLPGDAFIHIGLRSGLSAQMNFPWEADTHSYFVSVIPTAAGVLARLSCDPVGDDTRAYERYIKHSVIPESIRVFDGRPHVYEFTAQTRGEEVVLNFSVDGTAVIENFTHRPGPAVNEENVDCTCAPILQDGCFYVYQHGLVQGTQTAAFSVRVYPMDAVPRSFTEIPVDVLLADTDAAVLTGMTPGAALTSDAERGSAVFAGTLASAGVKLKIKFSSASAGESETVTFCTRMDGKDPETADGYFLRVARSGAWSLARRTAGTETALGSGTLAESVGLSGDKAFLLTFGAENVDGGVSVFLKAGEEFAVDVTDAGGPSEAGYFGVAFSGTDLQISGVNYVQPEYGLTVTERLLADRGKWTISGTENTDYIWGNLLLDIRGDVTARHTDVLDNGGIKARIKVNSIEAQGRFDLVLRSGQGFSGYRLRLSAGKLSFLRGDAVLKEIGTEALAAEKTMFVSFAAVNVPGGVLLYAESDGIRYVCADISFEAGAVSGCPGIQAAGVALEFKAISDPYEIVYEDISIDVLMKDVASWDLQGDFGVKPEFDGAKKTIATVAANSIFGFTQALEGRSYALDFSLTQSSTGDAWAALQLLNNVGSPWDPNTSGYYVLFYLNGDASLYRADGAVLTQIEAYRLNDFLRPEDVTATGWRARVEFGKTDTPVGTAIRLKVNGEQVFLYEDMAANALKGGAKFVGMNYGGCNMRVSGIGKDVGALPVTAEGVLLEEVTREGHAALSERLSANDFAPILSSYNPLFAVEDGACVLSDAGAAAYRGKLTFTELRFTVQFADMSVGQKAMLAFNKKRRSSYLDQRLADYYDNYGYAVQVYPSGRIQLVKTTTRDAYSILLDMATNLDFVSSGHTVTLRFEAEDSASRISVFVDDSLAGYRITDETFGPDFGYGYVGLQNFGGGSVSFSDIGYLGSVENAKPAGEPQLEDSYFAQYFEQVRSGGETERFLHFVYNRGSAQVKWVEILDGSGRLLSVLRYPKNIYEIPADYTGTGIRVVTVGLDGERLESTVSLEADQPQAQPLHRIGIRNGENRAQFYDTVTGEAFIARGANYMQMRGHDHATFDADTETSTAFYDPYHADSALKALAENNMNLVRIFLVGRSAVNRGISGNFATTEGIYGPYMENVVDFIGRAKRYGIHVEIVFGDGELPTNQYFLNMTDGTALGINQIILTEKGIAAKKKYVELVLGYIKENAPEVMDAIFGVQLQNEAYLHGQQWPFNLESGSVTLATGKTYDMSDLDSRQAAADEGRTLYYNTLVDAIKAVDSNLLVSEGTFTLNAVGLAGVHGLKTESQDARFPATIDLYLSTKLDFLDYHSYATGNATVAKNFADDANSMNFFGAGVQEALTLKPMILGEFGSFVFYAKSWEQAKKDMLTTLDLAFDETYGFQGYMCWTFDQMNQRELFHLMTNGGDFLEEFGNHIVDSRTEPGPGPTETTKPDPSHTAQPATGLPGWGVALIVVGVVLVLGGGAGFWLFKQRRKR